MRLTRIYTGEDGRSHFQDLELPYDTITGPFGGAREKTIPIRVNDFFFISPTEMGEPRPLPFHPAPARYYIFIVAGKVEYRVGSGETRVLGPGDLCLAEDVTGEGHESRGTADSVHLLMAAADFEPFSKDYKPV